MCSAEELPFIADGSLFVHRGSVRVTKRVHASTVTAELDKVHKKVENPSVCYPNVCFAVEDFEDAFSGLVIFNRGGFES